MPTAKKHYPRTKQISNPTASERTALPSWLAASVLVLLTIIVYIPVWTHGGFIWDDDDYVTENLTLRTLHGLWRIWAEPGATHQYYPLVHSTFWIEYHLWGLWSPGFHAVNVLLHAANAVLVWILLKRLQVRGAWLAAALFAVHPVHVESAAWITERKNVLSGLFYLMSLLTFLRAAPSLFDLPRGNSDRSRQHWFYAASLVCFVAALLSKTVTCTLPAVLLLLSWWKRDKVTRPALLLTAPFLLLGAALAAITVYLEKHQVGAQGKEWAFTFPERVLIAGRALWFYPAKLIWPHPLVFSYPKWSISSASLAQWVFPLSFAALIVLLGSFRRRLGNGPATAVLFYAGTIFPALGFFNVYPMRYSFVADHFQYLASLGIIALIASGLALLLERFHARREAFAALSVALLLPLSIITWKHGKILSNAETLWRDTLAKNPTSDLAHNNLGNLLTDQQKLEEGMQHYLAALANDSQDDAAHYNIGVNLYRQGKLPEAMQHYREAIRLRDSDFEAHYNLGKVLEQTGKPQEALTSYRRALTINPRFVPPRISLAVLLANLGQRQQAIDEYRKVLKLEPENQTAHFNIGAVLLDLGLREQAIAEFREAVRINPHDDEARKTLESLLASTKAK